MAFQFLAVFRSARSGLLPLSITVLSLAAVSQAVLQPSAAAPGAPSESLPTAQGWSGMPMAGRAADGPFIVMMIPHHQGAIAMADLALQRSRRPEIRALAERIRDSQSRENEQMRRWYRQWYGSDVPARAGPGGRWGMGMGWGMGWGMPGFATSLEALRTAPDFDRTFLEQMIAHHRMGVMMASHAQWGTTHAPLRELEASMVQVQSEEIAQMARWYQQWYSPGAQLRQAQPD